MEEPGGKKCPGWQSDMTKPFWTTTRNMPVLAAGELFMGVTRDCHLDGFRFDLSKHLFTSLAGPLPAIITEGDVSPSTRLLSIFSSGVQGRRE